MSQLYINISCIQCVKSRRLSKSNQVCSNWNELFQTVRQIERLIGERFLNVLLMQCTKETDEFPISVLSIKCLKYI